MKTTMTQFTSLIGATTVVFALFITTARAELASSDKSFMTKAAQGGMAEVAESQVVVDRSQNSAVSNFAQDMVKDHTAANQKLTELAGQKGVTLPTEPTMWQKHIKNKLADLKGAELDKTYMKQALKDHQSTVALFEDAAQNAKDPAVKRFAADTLPTLRHHLKMARDINNQVAAQ